MNEMRMAFSAKHFWPLSHIISGSGGPGRNDSEVAGNRRAMARKNCSEFIQRKRENEKQRETD